MWLIEWTQDGVRHEKKYHCYYKAMKKVNQLRELGLSPTWRKV